MRALDYALLPVRSPRESAVLYTKLLGCEPVQLTDGFALFVLANGSKLGLWLAGDVRPAPGAAGGLELAFAEASREAVLATHRAWRELGLEVLQEPTEMSFGFTFVAADPDGHRLRPFVLAANAR